MVGSYKYAYPDALNSKLQPKCYLCYLSDEILNLVKQLLPDIHAFA